MGRMIFGVTLFLVGIVAGGWLTLASGGTEAATKLKANAGPDQTVYLPTPVRVTLDGLQSQAGRHKIIRYRWYDEWGSYVTTGATPVIELDFGNYPEPGMTRSFKLVVVDARSNKATDWVTVTLGESEDSVLDFDPAEGATFTGATMVFFAEAEDGLDYLNPQIVSAGIIKGQDGTERWYIASSGGGQASPLVQCYQGTHWKDDTQGHEGCVGDSAANSHLEMFHWPIGFREGQLSDEWSVDDADGEPVAALAREEGLRFDLERVESNFEQPR